VKTIQNYTYFWYYITTLNKLLREIVATNYSPTSIKRPIFTTTTSRDYPIYT